LEVLEREGIKDFSILSHSNGVIYALYTLLNLREEDLKCRKWFMTSPWVPAGISGSIGLNLAGYVPGNVTNKLGSLAWGVQKAIGPLGVSMGFVRDCGNWSGGLIMGSGSGSSTKEATPLPRRKGTIEERIQHFESLQSLKPREEQTFGGKYYPSGMMDLGMKVVLEEGMQGMGEEARVCLRKGVEWGWVQHESGMSDQELYRKGFEALKDMRGNDLRVKVFAAGQDGLVPQRGRDWLKGLLLELGIVRVRVGGEEEGWKECSKMGHDEVLGLKFVVEEILRDVRE